MSDSTDHLSRLLWSELTSKLLIAGNVSEAIFLFTKLEGSFPIFHDGGNSLTSEVAVRVELGQEARYHSRSLPPPATEGIIGPGYLEPRKMFVATTITGSF
jgi:hypothetical protein